MMLRQICDTFLDIALPRACALCGAPLIPGESAPGPICAKCALGFRPWSGERCESCGLPLISEKARCMRCRASSFSFDSIYPLFPYAGSVRKLVSVYKKQRRPSLAPYIAKCFFEAYAARWADRIIVPVPPRPEKAKAQGWDQVEEIARCLEKRGCRVARILERRHSDQQKSLGRRARELNANRAFALKVGTVSPEQPLLIDDVVTTCSTIDACAKALKEGGARSVSALVFAAD
jgi:ComF family protein